MIQVSNLTFHYDTGYENIFENVSFVLDTDWKLGLIGRNGRGKTTLLQLLKGAYSYSGFITAGAVFDYFPFPIDSQANDTLTVIRCIIAPFDRWEREMEEYSKDTAKMEEYGDVLEQYMLHDGYTINELIEREISKLDVAPEVLSRPFDSLSNGEQTKVMIAALFLKKNHFLLIDEPTNHLDMEGRRILGDYLHTKNGFILVSHDRAFLDRVIDHVMSINRSDIEIQKGNFSTWKVNRDRQDQFEQEQKHKLEQEITSLSSAADRSAGLSSRMVRGKDGIVDRDFYGAKSVKVMKRAKVMESRITKMLDEKIQLLKNLEQADSLKLTCLRPPRQNLLSVTNLAVCYGERNLFPPVSFRVDSGDRVALRGKNGSGKSSILKLLLGQDIPYEGTFQMAGGLKISYVEQDSSYLKGSLSDYAREQEIEESLFLAILRKLDFTRSHFEQDMSAFSAGQKKKVLIAKSLSQPAHLYVWDEPLNYIDILSRIQIEELLKKYQPTMIFVEHDAMFQQTIANKLVDL